MAQRDDTKMDPGGPGVPGGPARRDPNNPTHLVTQPPTGPFIDPRVSSPQAMKYAAETAARRKGAQVPRYSAPVTGSPDLPIPRLDSEAQSGATMAQQAVAQRGVAPMPELGSLLRGMGQEPALSTGIVEGAAHQEVPTQGPAPLGQLPPGLLPGDLLAEQATADPSFRQGAGSMFAASQPHLAMKYGVRRGQQFVPPQVLQQAQRSKTGSALRPETLEGLKAIQDFQQGQGVPPDAADRQLQAEAQQGVAGGVGSTERALTDDEKKDLVDSLDDYDMSRLRNALFKDMLNNDEQKKLIEERLKPLDLSSLIMTGRVTQVVPIIPGKFEPEFQSYGAYEDLEIKRLMGEEIRSNNWERYSMDKYTLMGLTLAVRAINKQPLPDYVDEQGNFNEEKFWRKYNFVSRFNFHMIGSLSVNWFWFDMRVRKLFKADTLGNG